MTDKTRIEDKELEDVAGAGNEELQEGPTSGFAPAGTTTPPPGGGGPGADSPEGEGGGGGNQDLQI